MATARVILDITVTEQVNDWWFASNLAQAVSNRVQGSLNHYALPADASITVRVEPADPLEAVA